MTSAEREFHEETGFTAIGKFLELGSVRQKSGKIVAAWAFEGDCNPEGIPRPKLMWISGLTTQYKKM
jgi:predicted NUDIX family NTP pyrophosphohydrolase